jgi:hypothetical protein
VLVRAPPPSFNTHFCLLTPPTVVIDRPCLFTSKLGVLVLSVRPPSHRLVHVERCPGGSSPAYLSARTDGPVLTNGRLN